VESLKLLEQNIHQLLLQYQELYDRMQRLQEENIRQRDEILQSHAELQQLKQDYGRLQTAHALLISDQNNEELRLKTKQRISSLIAQVDKAIEVLKK
jgi:hypothetical protein